MDLLRVLTVFDPRWGSRWGPVNLPAADNTDKADPGGPPLSHWTSVIAPHPSLALADTWAVAELRNVPCNGAILVVGMRLLRRNRIIGDGDQSLRPNRILRREPTESTIWNSLNATKHHRRSQSPRPSHHQARLGGIHARLRIGHVVAYLTARGDRAYACPETRMPRDA